MKNKDSILTLRSIIIGIIGLLFVTVLSMYVALKMGALPWPTVFVTVFASVCLKRFKDSSLKEISCTHTLMSAGSMVAGGLAFTLPGIWIANSSANISFFSACVIAVIGSVLGTAFISVNRSTLIEKQNLPYPIGRTAYNTLLAVSSGKGAKTMFSSIAFSSAFSCIRDGFKLIPQSLTILKTGAIFPGLYLYLSPMALGIGAIIGTTLTVVWLIGMILGYYIITPVGISLKWFKDMTSANLFRENLGIGLMIGTGLGVALKALLQLFKCIKKKQIVTTNKKYILLLLLICIICVLCLVIFTEMNLLQSILIIPSVYIVSYLSGMLTGQTGINPMEIFAILIVLFIGAISGTTTGAAFSIACTVAVASGISGDVMNDFKSGSLVGTPVKDQLKAEALGGVLGAIIAVVVLFVLKSSYILGGADFPAPQSKAVASMINGLSNPLSFWIGLTLGLILFLLKTPSATLGLGVYLSTNITTAVVFGSLIVKISTLIFKRKNINTISNLIASGLLGGEGFAGILIALLNLI